MNCNVPYTPAILSGSVTFLEHFHSVFVCFRYVTQISCPCLRPCHIFGRLTRAEIGPENRRRAENADVVARLQLKVTFFASTQLAKTDDYNADGDGRKIRSKSDIFCATPAH